MSEELKPTLVMDLDRLFVWMYEIIAESSSRIRPCMRWMLDKFAPVPFKISEEEVR